MLTIAVDFEYESQCFFNNKFIIALEKQHASVLFEFYQYAQNTHNNGPGICKPTFLGAGKQCKCHLLLCVLRQIIFIHLHPVHCTNDMISYGLLLVFHLN